MLLRLFAERLSQVLVNKSSIAEEVRGNAKHDGYGLQGHLGDSPVLPLDGKQLTGRPWMQPVLMAISVAKSEKAPPAVVESLYSMAEGGWWPQARLCSQGYAEDQMCQVCLSTVGTCLHRLTALHSPDLVPSEKEADLLRHVALHSKDSLYFRGIPTWPAEVTVPEEDVQVLRRQGNEGPLYATGDVYTDGALTGLFRAIKRAGWALAVLREDLSVEWAVYGICGELDPSILRAELRAVLEALRMALPPLVIHTDNAEVVNGYFMGEEWACDAGREGADLWRQVWHKLNDIGGGVEIRKVKAHTTEDDVLEGLIDLKHHKGNAAADALAVHARKVAEARAPTASFRETCVRTCQWYRWCRRVIAHWVDDTKAEDREEGGVGHVRRSVQGILGRKTAAVRHRLWMTGGGSVMCQRCGLTRPLEALVQFRRQVCAGCPSGRLLARVHADAALMSQVMSFSDHDMTSRGAIPVAGVGTSEAAGNVEEAAERGLGQAPEPARAESDGDAHREDEDPFGHLFAGLDASEPPVVSARSPERSAALPAASTAAGYRAHRLRKHGSTAWCEDRPGPEASLRGTLTRTPQLPPAATETPSLASRPREHRIRRHGSTAWCDVCGRWAISRVGLGLLGQCSGEVGAGSYYIRRERLRAGKHPLTGRPL